MKKGYIIGMVIAVIVITSGIFLLSDKQNAKKTVNSEEVTTKIEEATKAIDSYYGEVKVSGAVGDKKGAYLVKQWYKKGKLYSENYTTTGSTKKQQLQKTSISLKDNNETTIYNIDAKTATITSTSANNTLVAEDSNFLLFPLNILKNSKVSNITEKDNEYTIDIQKDDYQYTIKYNKDTLMPINVEVKNKGKFLSAIDFEKLDKNIDIKEKQFVINIPKNTKILKQSYTNENSDLIKIRNQVKYPVLTPGYLPKGVELDKVTKEVFDTTIIVNISYKGLQQFKVIETAINKDQNKIIPPSLKKVSVGKYQGYLSKNGNNIYISWEQGNTSITVYGEVDSKTLMQIATSFK